jgi:hypothetical protein
MRSLRALAIVGLAWTVACPGGVVAQDSSETAWQAEKCRIFETAWAKALDFFGSDNLNYNFIAQNENFIASGCSAEAGLCPRSSQELEIANALTIEMMNAGAASTFLPYACPTSNGI